MAITKLKDAEKAAAAHLAVAKRESGTPDLAEARRRVEAARDALWDARSALRAAAAALPGARRGLEALTLACEDVGIAFGERVARPFDQALLEELLHRPPARKEGTVD